MGTMKIAGQAKRKFTCDRMTINVCFSTKSDSTEEAIESCMEQSKDFLIQLKDLGLDITKIRLERNELKRKYKDDEFVTCERKLSLDSEFDMPFLNRITKIIRDCDYDCYIDTEYYLSNLKEIHNQLIEEAFRDSEERAKRIADITGQKIIGTEKIEIGDKYHFYTEYMDEEDYVPSLAKSVCVENALSAKEVEEEESVAVIWKLE